MYPLVLDLAKRDAAGACLSCVTGWRGLSGVGFFYPSVLQAWCQSFNATDMRIEYPYGNTKEISSADGF